jgi:hypothetical protein
LSDDGVKSYLAPVTLLGRILVLVALLLMPFGMGSAHATVMDEAPMAGMPMGHCPDQPAKHDSNGGIAECTMACAAALPAIEQPSGVVLAFVPAPAVPALTRMLVGLHPDIATPPPKNA